MSDIATLSSEYRISIPKEMCEARGWNPGQKFAFIPKESGVLLVPVPTIQELRGSAKGATITNYRDRKDRY